MSWSRWLVQCQDSEPVNVTSLSTDHPATQQIIKHQFLRRSNMASTSWVPMCWVPLPPAKTEWCTLPTSKFWQCWRFSVWIVNMNKHYQSFTVSLVHSFLWICFHTSADCRRRLVIKQLVVYINWQLVWLQLICWNYIVCFMFLLFQCPESSSENVWKGSTNSDDWRFTLWECKCTSWKLSTSQCLKIM